MDSGTTATYTYNALGWRVEKKLGAAYTEYFFGASGDRLGENNRTTWTESYVPLGYGQYAIYQNNATYFTHPNALGSTTMVTDYDGNVVQDKLFYPWGQDWQTMGSVYDERFAKLQRRDTETSLDPTANRMFASGEGRWLTPDPAGLGSATPDNPQTFNRYSYVLNRPCSATDSSGLLDDDLPTFYIYMDDAQPGEDDMVYWPETDPYYDASNGGEGWYWGPSPAVPGSLSGPRPPAPCDSPILQPQYLQIYKQVGTTLKVNPLFIMSVSLQESGWNLSHVYGTNSSSKGQPLNNLFGSTYGGGNNIAYPTVQASAAAWENNWGPYLTNSPPTIQAFTQDLTSNPKHKYNGSPAWSSDIANDYDTLLKELTICNIAFP